ncbi:hypothetical protein GH714_023553 [Hevea brasiliensis]|uniref:Uncharacterized protein n=1 Tax=Hevea brasiliensis TaxID=3981 RepID=A0A6A6KF35_HEVBR|nr:hypothetical protein GH714_023553 [Hevea brasiliensis]
MHRFSESCVAVLEDGLGPSDKLRVSRSGISEADVANEFTLGIPGEAFSFSHCSNKVTIAESSGLTGEISQVEQFIREHVDPMIG